MCVGWMNKHETVHSLWICYIPPKCQDHTELVASGRPETLIQVYWAPTPILCPRSTWHGLARGQKAATGELKVSVVSAGVKEQGQGLLVHEEGMEGAGQAVGSQCSDHVDIMLLSHSFIRLSNVVGPFHLLWLLVAIDTNMKNTVNCKNLIVFLGEAERVRQRNKRLQQK